MVEYVAYYQTKTTSGWTMYDSENEMYADLEVQNIVEDNDSVMGISYYELTDSKVSCKWDFGKPYKF